MKVVPRPANCRVLHRGLPLAEAMQRLTSREFGDELRGIRDG